MKIYLCRHGETVFNKERRWQGQTESPLTENGLRQSWQMAGYLKDQNIDAIFASPLKRAKKSSAFLRKHFPNVPYFEMDALKEINCGEAEGITFEETKKRYPHLVKRINLEDLNSAFPMGETYNEVKERLKPFVKKLKQEYWGKTVVIMAHGGTNRMLVALLLSLPDDELVRVSTPNDVVYEIDLNENTQVHYIRNGERKEGFVFRSN